MSAAEQDPVLRARALCGHCDPTNRGRRIIARGALLAADDPAVQAQPHLFLVAYDVSDAAFQEARRGFGLTLIEEGEERERKKAAEAEKERRAARTLAEELAESAKPGFIQRLAQARVDSRRRRDAREQAAARAEAQRVAHERERRNAAIAYAELVRRQRAGLLDDDIERAEAELAATRAGGSGEAAG